MELELEAVQEMQQANVPITAPEDEDEAEALGAAAQRGVSIRVIFEGAGGDRSDPDGSVSAQLEEVGIEVRYVNKIMHHKFAIIDGARTE